MAAVRAASAVINQFEGQADVCTLQSDTPVTEQKFIVSIERIQPQNATNGENIEEDELETDQSQDQRQLVQHPPVAVAIPDTINSSEIGQTEQAARNQDIVNSSGVSQIEQAALNQDTVAVDLNHDLPVTDQPQTDQKEVPLEDGEAQAVVIPDTGEVDQTEREVLNHDTMDVNISQKLPATGQELPQMEQAEAPLEESETQAGVLPDTGEVDTTEQAVMNQDTVDVDVSQDLPVTDQEQPQTGQAEVPLEDGELEASLPSEQVAGEQSDSSVGKTSKVGVSSDTAVDSAPIELDVVVSTVEDDFSAFSAEAAEVESNQQNLLSSLSSKTHAESEKGGDIKRSEGGEESKDESEVMSLCHLRSFT